MMYVLHVLTGEELNVQNVLGRGGYSSYVPQEIRMEHRRGSWHQKLRTVMPSYVFVHMDKELTAYDYYCIKHTNHVINVLGNPPQPLTRTEEKYIDWLVNDGKRLEPSTLVIGEKITVVAGPLKGYEAEIVKVDPRQRRAVLLLPMLGRDHYITLSIDVLENSQCAD